MVNVVEYLTAQGGLEEAIENMTGGHPRRPTADDRGADSPAESRGAAGAGGGQRGGSRVLGGSRRRRHWSVAVEEVEEQCEGLARREQFLRARETSRVAGRDSGGALQFPPCAVSRSVVRRRFPRPTQRLASADWRARRSRRMASEAQEIAAELAVHFERGRDYRRAIQYLQQAGENALRRSAYQEAISLLTKGLELLKTLPDTPERTQQELTLQLALGDALIAVKGYTAPEVEKT